MIHQIGHRFQGQEDPFASTIFGRRFRRSGEQIFSFIEISVANFIGSSPDFHTAYIRKTHFLNKGSKF